jgi:beta-glucosidase
MDVSDILKKLTIQEKCLLLTGKSFWETVPLPKLGLPSLIVSDGPFGLRKVVEDRDKTNILETSYPATCFPASVALSSTWNDLLIKDVGEAIGRECNNQGVDILLGPGLNIKRSPLCGRNFEYFSEDPYLSGRIASYFVRGVQSTGVGACLKHFVANNQEDSRLTMNAIVDERAMREIYAKGFEIAIKESNPMAVMCAYNRVNGLHVSRNPDILKTLLRKKLGFKGIVISDWGAVVNTLDSVVAGLNLEMPGGFQETKVLLKALKQGVIQEQDIDEAITPLLNLMLYKKSRGEVNRLCDYEANHKLSVEVAEEAIVLLKNEEEILPLNLDGRLAVFGFFAKKPRIQGAGSSKVNLTKNISFVDVLERNGINYLYSDGFSEKDEELDPRILEDAKGKAGRCDKIIIFMGLPESSEAESYDRKDILMPKNQCQFIEEIAKINKNIIVVLTAGSPVNMQWYNDAKAIVHAHLLGQGGSEAIFNVLFGEVNPSGKLTESYPYYVSDNPTANYFGGKKSNVEYRESIFVGYRYYDLAGKYLQFPFGFGLSYTKFSYRDLELSKDKINKKDVLKVKVTIKNIGKYRGKEVVQLYVGQRFPKVFKPLKELRAYKKVAIDKGQSKTITFTLTADDFTYFNPKLDKFQVENGTYTIYVGPNVTEGLSRMVTFESDDEDPDFATVKYAKSYYNLKSFERLDIPFRDFEEVYGSDIRHVYPNVRRPFTLENSLKDTRNYRSARFLIKKITSVAKGFGGGSEENEQMVINSFMDIPFRSYVSLTGGAISAKQVQGIIDFCNGKILRGIHKLKPGKTMKKQAKAKPKN